MAFRLNSIYNIPPAHVLLFELLVSSAAIGFTTQDALVRPAALLLIATCVYGIVSTANLHMRTRWASLIGGTSFSFLLQYVDLAFLSRWNINSHGSLAQRSNSTRRWDFETHGTASVKRDMDLDEAVELTSESTAANVVTSWERFCFGWSSTWSFRHLSSPYEVKNVKSFSKQDPSYIPTRGQFVVRRSLIAVICYAVLDLLGARPPPRNAASLFDPAHVPILRRLANVTANQLRLRALSSAGFWVTLYVLLQGGHAAASVVAVAFNLSSIKQWRPIFGSLSSIYTLRNFWGYDTISQHLFALVDHILFSNFWHQSLRRPLTEPASYMTPTILQLPRGSIVGRYLNILLIFGLSGILHNVAGISSGMPLNESGVLQFFCTQTLGIIVEDGIQAFFNSSRGKTAIQTPPSTLTRCIGYAWVIGFLIWSTPAWLYPQASRPINAGPSSFLPYSIIQALRSP